MHDWDTKLEFLINIRKDWCNSDYIEFLIEKVWRIDKPINVVDFGCGYGYLADLFMPLLPKGSTYTGIDSSKELLKAAEKHLAHHDFLVSLIEADLREYVPEEIYDIAICNAVLRHIPNPKSILAKMKDSVTEGGMVICFEGDRPIEDVGLYSSLVNYFNLGQSELYRKMQEYEHANGGRDYRTGIKMPQFMQEIGLNNIGVRMNDSVKFMNPFSDDYEEKRKAFAESKGFYDVLKNPEIQPPLAVSLDAEEKQRFLDNQKEIAEAVVNGNGYIIQTPCVLISFGWK